MALWDNFGNNNNDSYQQPQPEPQQPEQPGDGLTDDERREFEQMQREEEQQNAATAENENADGQQTDVPADAAQPVEGEAAGNETVEGGDAEADSVGAPADGETNAEGEGKTPADDGHADESKSKRPERKAPAKGRMPRIDQWNMQKLGDLWDALKDPQNAAVAKLLLGSGASSPAVLASLMTEPKNQKKVNATIAHVRKLYVKDDALTTTMNLLESFIEDPELAKTLVGLLRAAAPDKGFVNASGNPKADARNIASRWDDTVDLSVLDNLKI